MICEPYICIRGSRLGEIRYAPIASGGKNQKGNDSDEWLLGNDCEWQEYADFERAKLREIFPKWDVGVSVSSLGYCLHNDMGRAVFSSYRLTGYTPHEHFSDSESSRLLKRADFLNAVCEKEGVEWLPEAKECSPYDPQCKKEFCATHKRCIEKWYGDHRCNECGQMGLHVCKINKEIIMVNNAEERAWRRALLDFLALPNVGFARGEHLPYQEVEEKWEELRKKYL